MGLLRYLASAAAVAALLAGCGGAAKKGTPSPSTPPASTAPAATEASTGGASALQAEATSATAGDIPDNQVFLTFQDPAAGYSIKYPEGWAQSGSGSSVTFRDKNNIVRVVVTKAPTPTAAGIRSDLSRLAGARVEHGPKPLTIAGAPAFKAAYTTESAPNAVTGKRVTLVVDRYYLFRGGREAVVDLGTPKGVDNVDAYRLMIESFRWR